MRKETANHLYSNGILKIPQAIARRLLPTTSSSAVTVTLGVRCVYVTFVITLPLGRRYSSRRQIMSSGHVPWHNRPPIQMQPQKAVKQWRASEGRE